MFSGWFFYGCVLFSDWLFVACLWGVDQHLSTTPCYSNHEIVGVVACVCLWMNYYACSVLWQIGNANKEPKHFKSFYRGVITFVCWTELFTDSPMGFITILSHLFGDIYLSILFIITEQANPRWFSLLHGGFLKNGTPKWMIYNGNPA